jgi:hypothetical protein
MKQRITPDLLAEAAHVAESARRDAEQLIEDAWSDFAMRHNLSPALEERLRDHPEVRL